MPIVAFLLILNASYNTQKNNNKTKVFSSKEKAYEACEKWAKGLELKNPNYDMKTSWGYKLYFVDCDSWSKKGEKIVVGEFTEAKDIKYIGELNFSSANSNYKSTNEYQECRSEAEKYQQRYGKYKMYRGNQKKDLSVPWFICGVEDNGTKLSIEKRRSRVVKKFSYLED